MELYQHDSSSTFRFELRGCLEGAWVQEFRQAWVTARSVLQGKELVIDVAGLTGIDDNGVRLLSAMRDAGARLCAGTPPELPSLAGLLGIAIPSGADAQPKRWAVLARWIKTGLLSRTANVAVNRREPA